MSDERRRKTLEAAGLRTGDVSDFLDLDERERLYLEIRRSLGRLLRRMRGDSGASQTAHGERIGMDQATISRAEQAEERVSLGLIMSALIASGASRDDIAAAIRTSGSTGPE